MTNPLGYAIAFLAVILQGVILLLELRAARQERARLEDRILWLSGKPIPPQGVPVLESESAERKAELEPDIYETMYGAPWPSQLDQQSE